MTATNISFLLLLLILAVRSHQRTVQGEQECTLVTHERESKGVLVAADQCITFREQPENKDLHPTHPVCCAVFRSDPTCGRLSQYADEFSFDSRETQLDQFPWAAMVLLRRVQKLVCSGSLIASRFVLSAAHCFVDVRGTSKPATDYRVRLGDWDLELDEDCLYVRGQLVCNEQQPVDYAVERIISHGDFQRQRRDFLHDIALLKLAEAVEYGAQIGPACLPNWNVGVPLIAGQKFTVFGWGRTRSYSGVRRKYKIEMPGRNISACVRAYGLRAPEVPRIHLCVGGVYRKDVCHGDSGGALMRRESNRWVQEGIVSFGAYRCGKPLPGVYTNVAHYIDWIQWAIDVSSS
ncbi:CLIP domain-containing serine protease 14D-like [Anopheles merus]|uniref:CLIP domain-containing serine protease 14D-like n=1 Tax=Anopheles merus TaxID=30066 RepID=UPI001BE47512|nr:CLIP domain-containing serine protease 14D-like [Anopheles merus]